MKKIQAFIVLFSATVVVGHLLSTTASAQGCLYSNNQSELRGFSQPLFGSDSFSETNFLESREATIAGAALIAGLFGLNALFSQYKAKQSAATEIVDEAVDEPETTAEITEASHQDHPEAPGGELDTPPTNSDEPETVEQAEPTSVKVTETVEITQSADAEQQQEAAVVS